MIRLAIYLAFGLLFHIVFVGPQLDAANAWTWVWVLLWPVALFVTLGIWILVIAIIVLAGLWIRERVT